MWRVDPSNPNELEIQNLLNRSSRKRNKVKEIVK